MKKLICLGLALLMLCFTGCGKETEDTNSTVSKNNEIEKIVESGKFEDAEYGIGAAYDEVKNHYKKVYDDYMDLHTGANAGEGHEDEIHSDGGHDHENFPYYSLNETEDYVEIETEAFRFYIDAKDEEKGVMAVATDGDVFSFTANVTTKQEIEEKVGSVNKTINATEQELAFVGIAQEDTIVLRYEYEKNILDFYFCENTLQTTVIRVK